MYKVFITLFCCAVLFIAAFSGCSKKSSPPATPHQLTYKVTANNYTPLSNISYVDTSYAPVVGSAADSSSGWSKTYTVPVLFSAQLGVQGINSTSNTLYYTLEIDEDGAVKSKVQDSAVKFNSFSTQISATIQ